MQFNSATDAMALFQMGKQHLQHQEYAAAEASLRQAIEGNPHFPQAYGTLAYLLHHVDKRLEEAEKLYRTALQQAPGMPQLHRNLGALLLQQQRFSEAEATFGNALQLEPDNSDNWSNLGSLYLRAQREADAQTCLRKAIALQPGSRTARFNLSYLLLRHGHFSEGWEMFEARDWYARFEQSLKFPRWQGESLQDKSLVLCLEAGHGDVIHFVRYASLLKASGVRHLALLCHPALTRLLQDLPTLDQVISYGPQIPTSGYDYWMPLMSAPYRLHLAHHPDAPQAAAPYAELPYLFANPARCAQWSDRLPAQGLRVGLVWQGNPEFEFDRSRSLPGLETLLPLWQIPGLAFISLQKGAGEAQALEFSRTQPLTCLGHAMQDFADAAAIVAQLDLVISVDSAMAHLAGALGKPCWVLLPDYMCDWRWGSTASDSAWYPGTLRLFRQSAQATWEPVVRALGEALGQWNTFAFNSSQSRHNPCL